MSVTGAETAPPVHHARTQEAPTTITTTDYIVGPFPESEEGTGGIRNQEAQTVAHKLTDEFFFLYGICTLTRDEILKLMKCVAS